MQIYIRETAKAHGVSLVELASRLKVTRQTIHYYCEQGDRNPVGQLEKIADAIGVPVTELFVDPSAPGVAQDDFIAFVRVGGETRTFESLAELRDFVGTTDDPGGQPGE